MMPIQYDEFRTQFLGRLAEFFGDSREQQWDRIELYTIRDLMRKEGVYSGTQDLYNQLDRALCAWLRHLQYRAHLASFAPGLTNPNIPADAQQALQRWPMAAADWSTFTRDLLTRFLDISDREWPSDQGTHYAQFREQVIHRLNDWFTVSH